MGLQSAFPAPPTAPPFQAPPTRAILGVRPRPSQAPPHSRPPAPGPAHAGPSSASRPRGSAPFPSLPGSPVASRDHRSTQAEVSTSAASGIPGRTMAEKTQKSVKIAPGAVVCVESEIRGDVTIGPRTVIHPKARIIAEAGPIVIGEGNLIEEQALIINAYPDNITPDVEDPEPKPMVIGTNNVFEVGCYSQAMKMGDNNVIESKAYVGRNVILTSGCIIGACCNLNTFEVIPENTVIYGADCLRRVQTERPQPQTLQLDFLMKILPNYHHLKKTMKGSSTPVKN
uniref:Dynactin subunit 6 n=2 Tax=Oryctolagus cuniculus TaxID=9986 RepID=G1T0C5_RABIT